MKKTLPLILVFLCPLLAFAKGFTIKGNIQGLQTGSLTLAYVNEAGNDTMLTSAITGGSFVFAGQAAEPELAKLNITQGWAYTLDFFLENTTITIHLVKDDAGQTTLTGCAAEIVYQKLPPGLNAFFEHARQYEATRHQSNPAAVKSADSLFTAQQQQWIQTISQAIQANTDNYAALYFIKWLLFKPVNYDAIFAVYNQLSPAVRNSIAGKSFPDDFQHLHKTSVGQTAPEISGNDTSGHAVTLAQFKGKVILLDFWSSYCGPCRQENKRVQPVYNKYHPAGFEIISLSLDNERRLWLQAILADGMTWPQASDLRGGAGASGGVYDITDLPRNVLIDRTGKIFAKDIHGDDLVKAIEKLLGKGK